MYDRVLVPLDGSARSEQVLPYAKAVAHRLKAPLHLLRVVLPRTHELGWASLEGGVDAVTARLIDDLAGMEQEEVEAARENLHALAGRLRDDGFSVHITVALGDPAEVIATEADRISRTLIAMATHGRSGPGHWLVGSVTDKVIRHAYHPTLVVRSGTTETPPGEPQVREIIAPLDGSELAERALPHAVQLAGAFGARLVLLHAVRIPPDLPEDETGWSLEDYNKIRERAEEGGRQYLAEIADRLRRGVKDLEERLSTGPPDVAILEAEGSGQDCIVVMCTHGRSGIRRWLLGSVTDRVVQHGRAPVLVTRAGIARRASMA